MNLAPLHEHTVLCLIFVAALLFLWVGLSIRRYAAASFNRRPIGENIFTRAFRKTRVIQLKTFRYLATNILHDLETLEIGRDTLLQQRALMPMVSEIRKKGQSLVASRSFYHKYLAPHSENFLDTLVLRLINLEKSLQSLPKSKLTIEDVLAGRFDS